MIKKILNKDRYAFLFENPIFTGCLISENNTETWFKDGEWHREDGPAYVQGNHIGWYLNGIEYTHQRYIIEIRKLKLERILKNINAKS